jgi:hypothetical protein
MSPSQLFNWYWGSREYGIYEDFNTVSATNMIHISSKSRPYLSFSIYYFLFSYTDLIIPRHLARLWPRTHISLICLSSPVPPCMVGLADTAHSDQAPPPRVPNLHIFCLKKYQHTKIWKPCWLFYINPLDMGTRKAQLLYFAYSLSS